MKKVASALFLSIGLALSAESAENGIIIDGINFALAQNILIRGVQTPVIYSNNFLTPPNNKEQPTWMLDCSSSGYLSCRSPFVQDLKKATGETFQYLLLDFPSIDTDLLDPKSPPSALSECQVTNGSPEKFSPQVFNYVAPFLQYSEELGDSVNVCVSGAKITQAFSQAGYQSIPMISGVGSDLSLAEQKKSGFLETLATLIAIEINGDKNAFGVAFDIEPALKGGDLNQKFYGTLSLKLAQGKVILIYNGDWSSIKNIPSPLNNIIALGPMYDFGEEDSTQNHWFQTISPNAFGTEYPSEFNGFLNGYASGLPKMIVLSGAASDTMWTGLSVMHNSSPDPKNPISGKPSNYDPYSPEIFNKNNNTGNPDQTPESYIPPHNNSDLALKTAPNAPCLTFPDIPSLNENCYGTPYPEQKGSDENSYITQALSPTTLNAIHSHSGHLKGVILYNIKPDNFYELNCNNELQQENPTLCLGFEPETIPKSVIDDIVSFQEKISS